MQTLISAATALTLLVSPLVAQVEHVDPTIGGVAPMLVPTRPLVHMPNSMVRVHPVRKDQLDLKISSFPLSIVSPRHGELFSLMIGNTPNRKPGTTNLPPSSLMLHPASLN
jgi:hypothetical protein